MKPRLLLCLALVMGVASFGRAQTFTNLTSDELLEFVKTNLFDLNKPFTAVAEMDFSGGAPLKINAGVCVQDGNARFYVDMGDATSGLLPPELAKQAIAERKREGINRYVVLLRKGDPIRYTLYLDRHTYHTNDYYSFVSSLNDTNPTTLKLVPSGTETVNGHFCRKTEWQMTAGSESGIFLTSWQAKDLNGFPVKLQVADDTTINFTQIKFEKVDPSLFEIPADYRCLDTVEAIEAEAGGRPAAAKTESKEDMTAHILKWHEELAEQGDSYGELRMGLRYRDGDGVPKDYDKARDLLQKAAAQGDPDAALAVAKLPKSGSIIIYAPTNSLAGDADIVLVSAEFGMGKKVVDVTARLAGLLQTQEDGFSADAKTLGQDPLPGKKKRLVIHYECKGSPYVFTIGGGSWLTRGTLVSHANK